MGELQHEPFQFEFNGFLKVAFQGSRITSDAGLLLVRELDERLGLATLIAEHLSDSRQGLNTQFGLADLLRQSVYSRLAGYEDLNDAVRVSADPTFRLIGSPTRWDRGAALTSTLHWFETDLLTGGENLLGLMAVNRELLARAEMPTRAGRIVIAMDSSESPVHGAQEGSAYNGHFTSVCYHPLFLFNEHGDCLAATLRPGNVPSADDWDDLLVPELERQQAEGTRVAFRADAAFAKPEIYDTLEQRDVDYAIRMPANKSLEVEIEDILFRPPGRPSRKPLVRYKSFRYQAKSWTRPRRIVAKVEHHRGELFPRVGFIVTNMVLPSRSVVRFYNKRGTAEQWIKEGKAGHPLDAVVVPSFPSERSAPATECPGLQPGQPLAQTRPAAAGQALVAHESPAAAGENRRPAGEACQVLLAPAGGRASDPAAVRRHVAEDLGAAGAGRLTRSRVQRSLAKKGHKCGAVSEKCPESSGSSRFPVERGPRLTGVGSRITCAEEIWRAERRVGV